MALTPQQLAAIEEAKKQGLTREQAMAKVFMPTIQKPVGRFADVGEDFATGGKNLWQSLRQRVDDTRSTINNPTEGGMASVGGNLPGALSDIIGTGLQVGAKAFMTQEEEDKVGNFVSGAVQKTGIPQAIANTSEETQRNLRQGSGFLELLGGGLFSKLRKPLSKIPETPRATPTPVTPATPTSLGTTPRATPTFKTAEQIGSDYAIKLRTEASRPDLSPRAREEAAQSALTFKEKWIGLRPDEKKRLQEMGEPKITEYLDATHLRNISDSPTPDSPLPPNVWGPQELGNYYVTEAYKKLEGQLSSTGSDIGKIKQKFATVQLQQPQVQAVTTVFNDQITNLGLGIKNGKIVELPNKISKTTGSDISAIQSLYDDLLKFKQSPTIENAYALRTNFDAKIKFGQSARDVSNAVDPLSRSVRSAIAGESAKVIGKANASELKKYSDFMDAYGDLKSFTDRSAGSEYLLRLVLSGRGREARDLVDTIKTYTGIDLMNDATAMKIAVERFANESQQNLFKQEVTRAGYDIAGLFQSGPVGIIGTIAQRLADYGIDAEDIIKATAAGAGGYILMTYYGEDGLTPAGLMVLAAMPDKARKEALSQAQKIAKSSGKALKLTDEMKDETLQALMKSDSMTPASKTNAMGGQTVDMDDFANLERLKALAEKPKGLSDIEYVEARAILEKYDSFKQAQSSTKGDKWTGTVSSKPSKVGNTSTSNVPKDKAVGSKPTTAMSGGGKGSSLVEEAKKYKSAEELSIGGGSQVSTSLANFIGKNAKTFNTEASFEALDGMVRKKLDANITLKPRFNQLLESKPEVSIEEIRKIIQGKKTPDGRPATINDVADTGDKDAIKLLERIRIERKRSGKDVSLREVIDYPELFAAYPSAKNIRVKFLTMNEKDLGSFYIDDRGVPVITVNMRPDKALETLKHELQHFIQAKEGFSMGGNPDVLFRSDIQNILLKQQLRNVMRDKHLYQSVSIKDMEYIRSLIEKTGKGKRLDAQELADIFGSQKEFNDMAFKAYTKLYGEVEANANTVEELLKVRGPIFGKSKKGKIIKSEEKKALDVESINKLPIEKADKEDFLRLVEQTNSIQKLVGGTTNIDDLLGRSIEDLASMGILSSTARNKVVEIYNILDAIPELRPFVPEQTKQAIRMAGYDPSNIGL